MLRKNKIEIPQDSNKSDLSGSGAASSEPSESMLRKKELRAADLSCSKEDDDRASIISEDSQDDVSPDISEKKFVDLNSLSSGTRRAAAPHIFNIFAQVNYFIFITFIAVIT